MQTIHRRPRAAGFTVSELMVTLCIGAILVGLGLPSFRSIMADNRMVLTGNSVRSAAQIARSTAISRNRQITFCAGQLDSGCHGDWSRGEWLVFDDRDRDSTVDAGENVHLAVRQPASSEVNLSGNGPFNSRVIFTPAGMAVTSSGAFAAGRIRVCVDRGNTGNALDLVLIGSGRIESEQKTLTSGCVPP
ncbi:MAG: GspH/FimT family pseudopilin [Stagnimonas sp.]|nr:GspH/FimT family pseudopilin [Stagnimonas sp.]